MCESGEFRNHDCASSYRAVKESENPRQAGGPWRIILQTEIESHFKLRDCLPNVS